MPSPSSTNIAVIGCAALAASFAGTAVADAQGSQQRSGGALTLSCPARLDTMQSAAPVPDWDQYRRAKGRLDSSGFYDGPVAENFELKPNGGSKRGNITNTVHRFIANRSAIHFACRYQGTDIVLSRTLPAGIKQCTVTSDLMKPSATDDSIVCR